MTKAFHDAIFKHCGGDTTKYMYVVSEEDTAKLCELLKTQVESDTRKWKEDNEADWNVKELRNVLTGNLQVHNIELVINGKTYEDMETLYAYARRVKDKDYLRDLHNLELWCIKDQVAKCE